VAIRIVREAPGGQDLRPLLEAHFTHAAAAAPAESNHTLDADGLEAADTRFWVLRDEGVPLGCGALKALPDGTAEVKSLHVSAAARGRGLARMIMKHLEAEARASGASALVLETGSNLCPGYDAARRLYEALGYSYCGPFHGYTEDPMSVFMRLGLEP
jgi:putative acetyltransferase